MNTLLTLSSQPWAQALGWTLLHFLWQGAALGLLAWVSLLLLRGASARARYGLACAFLILMVAAPAATFLLLQRQAPPTKVALRVEAERPSAASQAPQLAPSALAQQVKARLDPSLPWLLAVWASGVLLLSARFLGSWIRVQRLRHRTAVPVPAEWHLILSRLCRELKLSRTVRLLQSAAVEVPTALGWLFPVILLPACALSGLSPAQLEAILAHELAHIRRGDFLVNLLQSLVEVLLFYHPAVWWLSGRIRAERELCCDDVAAAQCGDPLLLARALTELEALRVPLDPSPTHLALAANGGSLMHRIRHLLHPALPVTSGARASALALLAASLLGAAGVVFQDKEPPADPKAEPHTRMKVIHGDRKLDLRLQGEVRLDAAAKEPVTVPGKGSFRLEEKKGGKIRAFEATQDKKTYTVDGQEKPLDAEAEAWLREGVKEAAQAQAGKDRARRVIVRTRGDGGHPSPEIEAHAKALDAHAREMEAHARALEAQDLNPEERTRIQAEMDKAKAELAKAKAELRKEVRLHVIETRAGDGDPAGKHVEIHTEEGGPGTVIIRKKVDGKEVVEKRVRLHRKGGEGKEGKAWTFIGPEGEDVILEGLDRELHIPPIHLPKTRLRHLPPMGPSGDPQAEMAEIKAELRALQSRLDHLQKQMSAAPKPPRPPKPPVPPAPPAGSKVPLMAPPPPPPPPPPAPDAPPAPPEPPAEPAR